jgi:zinc and cadmium transporter
MPPSALATISVTLSPAQLNVGAQGGSLPLILTMGLAMSGIALVGGIAVMLPQRILDRVLLPMVAFAAGSLLGGAFFHLIPEAQSGFASPLTPFAWTLAGFTTFLALELGLHWHRSHTRTVVAARPETILILLGDGLHNLLGGLAVGAAFTVDPGIGISAWLAAAAHEVPQELGDFAILVHGGFARRRALLLNFASALTFPIGAVAAWMLAGKIDVLFLLPFAAGNFIYIGAADLIPEIKEAGGVGRAFLQLACFLGGVGALWVLRASIG